MKAIRAACAMLALAVFLAGISYGQAVNGTLLGTITDASGASVPSAKVSITEQNTGVSRSDNTNESGNFTVPDVPPGTYNTLRIDLALRPGQISETVEVTAATPPLQTEVNGQLRQANNFQIEGIDDNERTGPLQIQVLPIDMLTIPTLSQRTGDLSGSTTVIYSPFTGNADGTSSSGSNNYFATLPYHDTGGEAEFFD